MSSNVISKSSSILLSLRSGFGPIVRKSKRLNQGGMARYCRHRAQRSLTRIILLLSIVSMWRMEVQSDSVSVSVNALFNVHMYLYRLQSGLMCVWHDMRLAHV
jgi:hypothetical protein